MIMSCQNPHRKQNYRRIHLSLQRLGLETAPLYRELGIRERDFSSEMDGIVMGRYLRVLTRAAAVNNRPFLGLEIAQSSTIEDLGALGYMVRNAPNLEHSLKLTHNYLELVSPGAETRLIKQARTCIWTYEIQGFTPEQSRQDVEMTLMQFVGHIRTLFAHNDWRPEQVFFRHAPPPDVMPLKRTLCDAPTFNHFYNGVAFPVEFLDAPINDADLYLLSVLEQQVQRSIDILKLSPCLLQRINLLLSAWLGKTEISADKVANDLGMSRRTLHRRLKAQDTSFNEQRELVVNKVAKEILCTTSVSITEAAQQLGYSDACAFNRAFKRLTGLTPQHYRRQHGQL